MLGLSSLSYFPSVYAPAYIQHGTTHIQDGSAYFKEPSLEALSQLCLLVILDPAKLT